MENHGSSEKMQLKIVLLEGDTPNKKEDGERGKSATQSSMVFGHLRIITPLFCTFGTSPPSNSQNPQISELDGDLF